jgi:hypothetical protein
MKTFCTIRIQLNIWIRIQVDENHLQKQRKKGKEIPCLEVLDVPLEGLEASVAWKFFMGPFIKP